MEGKALEQKYLNLLNPFSRESLNSTLNFLHLFTQAAHIIIYYVTLKFPVKILVTSKIRSTRKNRQSAEDNRGERQEGGSLITG